MAPPYGHGLPPTSLRRGKIGVLGDAVIVLLSGAFVLAVGPGQSATHDSAYYLNAAQHIASGHGYVTSSVSLGHHAPYDPISVFAPLFSGAIGGLIALGVAPREALAALVGLSFVLYALCTRRLIALALPQRWELASIPCTLVILCQPALRLALHMALSDLFSAALCLVSALWVLRGTRSLREDYALGFFLGLVVLTRWANLNFVLPASLVLLCRERPLSLRTRLPTMLRVTFPLAGLVLAVWLRNWLLTGTPMGMRTLVQGDLVHEAGLALQGATHWFARAHANLAHVPLLSTLHSLSAIALALTLGVAALVAPSFEARAAFAMVLGYGVLMVLASASVAYDPLSETRFWLLVHPLLVLAFISALCTVPWPRLARQALALTWAGLALHAGLVFARESAHELASPAREPGFFAARFAHSVVIQRALELHDQGECQLAADDAVTLLPHSGTRPLKVVGELELGALRQLARSQPLCLVLVRDARMPWSLEGEPEHVYQAVRRDRERLGMEPVLKDDVAELWLPRALAPARVAMP